MKSFKILFATTFFSLFLLQSCMIHKLKVNRSEKTFFGVKKIISESNHVCFFITHGMGVNNLEFADKLISEITNKEGFKKIKTTYNNNSRYSKVKIITYKKEDKKMSFYIHGWFPATSWKFLLHYVDTNSDRLKTMQNIKSSLMNESVSDVIMYQGNFRNIIKKDMEITLKLMVESDANAKIVGVSESLGSKIFIETMNDNLKSEQLWAKTWQNNLSTIFMLSNQLPLLYMGDLKPNSTSSITTKSQKDQAVKEVYAALNEYTKHRGNSDVKAQLIAISDPNDLLSYSVPKNTIYTNNFNLVNVFVSVAKKGYSWPFGKPLIVNPINAHLKYQENENVINYILNGYTGVKIKR